MSEIALVSSRKSRMEQLANQGNARARQVIHLISRPEVFLSTVQVGITLISIITGLYSGEKFGKDLEPLIARINLLKPYSATISTALVVIIVTFLSILIGELVPKRLAMLRSEKIALISAPVMVFLSKVAFPAIWLLNKTTALLFRLFNIKLSQTSSVTEEEIKALVSESAESGEIDEAEQEIIERVFHLGDRSITSLMTHRSDIAWLPAHGTIADLVAKSRQAAHSIYPICRNTIDDIEGVVQLKDLIAADKTHALRDFIRPAVYVPDNISPYKLMEKFKETKIHSAFIVDEYGTLQGMITLNDILEAIVGDIPEHGDDDYSITERKDGSYLVDGQLPFYDFLVHFDKEEWVDDEQEFDTVAGFLIHHLERIPVPGDSFEWRGFQFEIMDMDGARIDKVLVMVASNGPNHTDEEAGKEDVVE